MTPTEDLVLEVLAARYRLGELLWTFDSRHRQAIDRLAARGLVTPMSGIVERSIRASLTDAGIDAAISDGYVAPAETARLITRNRILAALHKVEQPEAPALATFLAYELMRPGGVA